LKASLNLLALSFVIGPTKTSNGSFVTWIASQNYQNKKIHCIKNHNYIEEEGEEEDKCCV
jgi:hypothetical protein